MVEIVDNLIFMGVAASVIAIMMIFVAWVGRSAFSGMWYQTGWIIAMLLLLIPVYWLIGSIRVQPEAFVKTPIPEAFREAYVRFMDRPIGAALGIVPNSSEGSGAESGALMSLQVRTVLFFCWLAGVVVLSSWKLIRYYTFRNMIIRQSVPSDERWVFAIPKEIRSKIKLRDASIPSPFVFGIFRPTVVMPAHAENKEDICFALMHELLHIERKDLLTKTIAEIVAVVHWANPFSWIIRNKVTLACENACDEAVAAKLNEDGRKGYALAILDFMDYSAAPEPNYPPTLMSFSGDSDHVKTRLKNIMRYRKMSRAVLAVSVGVIIVVLSVGVLTGFSLALSVKSARADQTEVTVPVESIPSTAPSSSAEEIPETQETEPVPAISDYSEELNVVTKGDHTLIIGANICETLLGSVGTEEDSVRFSSDRKSVAFLVRDSFSEDGVLYYSDGEKMLQVATGVSDFALSSDGLMLAYKVTEESDENTGPIYMYNTVTEESKESISSTFGHFALSPNARAIGASPYSEESVRVFFPDTGQTLSPDLNGSIIALSDIGDLVYMIGEDRGKPLLGVLREDKTTELLRGTDFSLHSPQRLILSRDRSVAIVLSEEKTVAFIDGKKTVLFENVSDIVCPTETTLLEYRALPGGFSLSVEEMTNESSDKIAVFAVDETKNQTKGILLNFDGSSEAVTIPGKILTSSKDAYRVLYRAESGSVLLEDHIFGNAISESVEIKGLISSAEQIEFAHDRSVYYLTDNGQLYRVSVNGKPSLVASGVADFALVSANDRTELYYLTDYREELFEQNGQTFKKYGRSLYAAKHGAVTLGRLVDTFVLRMEAGPYGVVYECVSHKPNGFSGCSASVEIFYSSDGEDFTKIMDIG
ncbi:MAG: M56 family metallopeptidase [Clostridiales bacterium]|nr:M56 family metallopeptidase [Clostridiales bacterium]